jgi:hypothetical protein
MRRQGDNTTGSRTMSRPGLPARWLTLVPVCLLTLCLVGCPGNNRRPDEGDVLKGDFKYLKENDSKTTHAKSPVPVASVPPIPEYSYSISTAAMAAAAPLQGGKPLSIPDKSAPNGKGGWTGPGAPTPGGSNWTGQPAGGNLAGQPGGGAIKLGPVQPLVPAGQTPGTQGGGVVPSGLKTPQATGAATVSYEQLQQELKKRGMLWHRAPEQTATGVKFTCAVPHPQEPQAEWVIEAEGPDLITAMQAALAQLQGQ